MVGFDEAANEHLNKAEEFDCLILRKKTPRPKDPDRATASAGINENMKTKPKVGQPVVIYIPLRRHSGLSRSLQQADTHSRCLSQEGLQVLAEIIERETGIGEAVKLIERFVDATNADNRGSELWGEALAFLNRHKKP